MINRTLIRLKVVQLLYAHQISHTYFKVYTKPERDTKEAQDIFNIYSDILTLIILVTGQKLGFDLFPAITQNIATGSVAHNSELIHELSKDLDIRKLVTSTSIDIKVLVTLTIKAREKILASTIYKDYQKKKNKTPEEEISLWSSVISTIILPILNTFYKDNNINYSEYALKKGGQDAQTTIKDYAEIRISFIEARNKLNYAINKAYQLYLGLLSLPIEIVNLRLEQIEAGKNKYLPSAEDLNPNTRLIESPVVAKLRENQKIKEFVEEHLINWNDDPVFLKNILNDILESDIYKQYLDEDDITLKTDIRFWSKIYEEIIFPSPLLGELMESEDVYWNDDLPIVGQFVIKSIERGISVSPQFRDENDHDFGIRLFSLAAQNYTSYRRDMEKFVNEQWDPQRLALMDVVILVTAIAEILNFPLIPLPVTMNEYTDIAASYSTPRNSQFVNGILYSLAEEFKKEGKIHK